MNSFAFELNDGSPPLRGRSERLLGASALGFELQVPEPAIPNAKGGWKPEL